MGWIKRLFGSQDAEWTTVKTDPTMHTTMITTDPIVPTSHKNMVLTGDEARQAVENIERAMNMDLDGDGRIGGSGGMAAPPGSNPWAAFTGTADDDVVSKLERLAKLRDSGALTEAEFQAQKAKLL